MSTQRHANTYCNNCNKLGHTFYNCKAPIMSHGIIAFRYNPMSIDGRMRTEYLMIRRKDTFGFIHFVRGKYSVHNKSYLLNIFNQMTIEEKDRIRKQTFDQLWQDMWMRTGTSLADESYVAADSSTKTTDKYAEFDAKDEPNSQYGSEESISREKFAELKRGIIEYGMKSKYTLDSLIDESNATSVQWTEPEWGFPKGRRNSGEKDVACAVREFSEETGYSPNAISIIENIIPFEETTMGSNYKSYKNKYHLAYMDYFVSVEPHKEQTCEVSSCEWKPFEEAVQCIRYYNAEKRELLASVNSTINRLMLIK